MFDNLKMMKRTATPKVEPTLDPLDRVLQICQQRFPKDVDKALAFGVRYIARECTKLSARATPETERTSIVSSHIWMVGRLCEAMKGMEGLLELPKHYESFYLHLNKKGNVRMRNRVNKH